MIHRRLRGGADLLRLHAADPARYPFLLQSVAGHPQSGRYDILFAFPGDALTCHGRALDGPHAELGDFLAALDAWIARTGPAEAPPDGLPFSGGWFVYCGYELGGLIEPRAGMLRPPTGLPTALAVRIPAAIVLDRQRGEVHLLAEQDPGLLREMARDLEHAATLAEPLEAPPVLRELEEEAPERFTDGVRRIIDYLLAGDAFQVNLSRRWLARFDDESPALASSLYRQLCRSNPAPFAGSMRWQDCAVLSSSPERLAGIRSGQVQTRPIAGTRPRGSSAEDDARLRAELIASLKERAEHVMLIDLERNDLGRVCESGSVHVSELMVLEQYAHVHHIVSNVTGCLRPDAGPGAVIRAVFPGGTITGCPKVRAMQIIAELESEGRGAYTGSMGYVGRDGGMDLNILIRSLTVAHGQAWLRAGAGIVADSDPQAELAETRAKARGLLLSLGAQA